MKIDVHKALEEEKKLAENWSEWSKEASTFDWSYTEKESCLILEGEATVMSEDGESEDFGPGDFVVFPAGLKCTWTIHQDLRKKYKFGD